MQTLKKGFFIIIIILLFTSACSQQQPLPEVPEPEEEPDIQVPLFENAQTYREKGFTLRYPESWVLLAEEKVQGSITLRLQEEGDSAAQVIISYFPGVGLTEGEALGEAEALLRNSLFRIKEEFLTKEEKIGDNIIPIIYTRSGETETKIVQTAVITGRKGYLLATLLGREETEEYFAPIFRSMLEGIVVE